MPSSPAQLDASPQTHADLAVTPAEHWPFYAEDEVQGVVDTLRSGKVNQMTGDRVFAFQRAYDEFLGTGRSIALANGSLALELALRAFGVGPGDEVVVTPRTFVASAFCAMLVGATPVFADVDPDSGNVTPETIAAVITPRTKVIIPVHLAGWPCDMPGIMALAKEHGVLVIEDCAQAHGAEVDGTPVGAFGDAAAFSFCQDKIMTTGGEGGLVTFRDEAAHDWAWSFKDHGKNLHTYFAPPTKPGFRWVHDGVGTNWRMLETSAVIGIAQLAKLPEWRRQRAERAGIWAEALAGIDGLRVPQPPPGATSAHYKFYAYVDRAEGAEELRDLILAKATALGIRAFSGSCSEVYLEAAFRDLGVERLPVARALGETSLMFEVHPTLDLDRLRARATAVAEVAREVLA
ncbi:MAG: Glutamine--scyllo-inositol transaminase [Thermoleophilia bacterium]|nr:Glutamine--scyllo-inositol transaminase [Thermoleophilia bacterium]